MDTRESRWVRPNLPSLPNPIAGLSVCLYNEQLYIIGGYSNQDKVASKEVAFLQSGSDDWVSICPMNIARTFSIACALNQFIYVLGGDSDSPCNSLERYNTKTKKWQLWIADIGKPIKYTDRLTVYNKDLYYLTKLRGCKYNRYRKYDKQSNKLTVSSCKRGRIQHTIYFIDQSIYYNKEIKRSFFIAI